MDVDDVSCFALETSLCSIRFIHSVEEIQGTGFISNNTLHPLEIDTPLVRTIPSAEYTRPSEILLICTPFNVIVPVCAIQNLGDSTIVIVVSLQNLGSGRIPNIADW